FHGAGGGCHSGRRRSYQSRRSANRCVRGLQRALLLGKKVEERKRQEDAREDQAAKPEKHAAPLLGKCWRFGLLRLTSDVVEGLPDCVAPQQRAHSGRSENTSRRRAPSWACEPGSKRWRSEFAPECSTLRKI